MNGRRVNTASRRLAAFYFDFLLPEDADLADIISHMSS